jgi:GH15 family glucan-1,4-alpha-glucosidase
LILWLPQRRVGVVPTDREADLVASVIAHVEGVWDEPDHGLWELRGHPQHYTYSQVSAWAAVDRFVRRDDLHRSVDDAFVERMVELRNRMHREICEKGFNRQRDTFVEYYGSKEVDPSLLNLPLAGFLPVTDPRIEKTIAAIERARARRVRPSQVARRNSQGSVSRMHRMARRMPIDARATGRSGANLRSSLASAK